MKGKFSVDEHRHYLLTPRDLTAWVRGLLRYELESENVLDCIAYEVRSPLFAQHAKHTFVDLGFVRKGAMTFWRVWRYGGK